MSEPEKPCDRFDTKPSPLAGSPPVATALRVGDLCAAIRVRDAYRGLDGAKLFGQVSEMPEKAFSHEIADPLDRIVYLTLAVSIDYQRDAAALWRHSRERYDDTETKWLFRPLEVAQRTPEDVLAALRRGNPRGALRYPKNDSAWWHRNASTLAREFRGDPRVLFESCGWDVARIRRVVNRPGWFQGLKGPKIFPLWLRMLADVAGLKFKGYDALPIPVDIHVARATFTTGLLRGSYEGPFDDDLRHLIRCAWTDTCREAGEAHMSFDEALWQLSRLGCTERHASGATDCAKRAGCPIGDSCPRGTIEVSVEGVRVST